MLPTRVFVYGTLKAGFPNAHVNHGKRVPGRFFTARLFSLYIVGDDHVPWLVDQGSEGEHVEGEVYDVAANDMPRMDQLEGIGQPLAYHRSVIEVRPLDQDGSQGPAQQATVYLQDMQHRQGRPIHDGPLKLYTLAHAKRYRHS